MTGEEATVAVIDVLESFGASYMLVGSFASNFYGIPRTTQDADFVLQLEKYTVREVAARLPSQFRLDPQTSFEMVTGTTRFVLDVSTIPFQIELFLISDDPHDQERFARRRRVSLLGRQTFLPTAEDVVITKLRWSLYGARRKDQDDARNVIAVQGGHINWEYVHGWCDRHGTRKLLDDIRRSLTAL